MNRPPQRRPANKPIDLNNRKAIVRLWGQGKPARYIAKVTGAGVSTVYRWIRRWELEGTVELKPRYKKCFLLSQDAPRHPESSLLSPDECRRGLVPFPGVHSQGSWSSNLLSCSNLTWTFHCCLNAYMALQEQRALPYLWSRQPQDVWTMMAQKMTSSGGMRALALVTLVSWVVWDIREGQTQDFLPLNVSTSYPFSTPQSAKTDNEVRVYHFQASERASTNSSLEFTSAVPELSEMTLCLWVKFRHFGEAYDSLVSYFTVGDDDLKFSHDWKNKEAVFWVRAYRLSVKVTLPLFTWIHFHVSVDFAEPSYHFLVNNRETEGVFTTIEESIAGKPVTGGGVLLLGQDQDAPAGGYSVTQAFSGDIAELYIFDKMMTKDSDGGFSCYENRLGERRPVVSLKNANEWRAVGDVSSSLSPRSLIDPAEKDPFYVLPLRKVFSEAARLCKILGLPVALPKSEEENDRIFSKAVAVEETCLSAYSTNIWVGAVANLFANEWQDANSGKELTYENFDDGYNFIISSRQCTSMGGSLYPKLWYNTGCAQYDPCPACENSPVNSIQIRGLCAESNFDRVLRIHSTMNLRPVFHGTYYTKMWWDNTTWVMASRLLPKLKAKMILKDPDDYPVGLRQWLISGDNCPAEKVDLLLTVCGEESFPCNDGTCVHMSQRCDLRAHCDDGSDEMECDKVFVGTDYEKTLPPPPPETEDVLNVTLSVVITAVRTLNLLDQAVTLDVQLMSQWKDSRLKYADLQPEQFKNQIQEEDRLWLTNLIITDDSGSLVDLVKRGSSVVVIQGSEPLPSDDTRATKAVLFSGTESPLLLRQELSITFQCQFNLQWFPFDNQRCSLNLRLNDVESKLVRMVASDPQYTGPKKLTEYEVREVTMEARQRDSGQKLTVVFTNLFLYYLANSYLPSFLLVVISYSTFYFRLEDFNERIMVSITAMLVLVALFQQTSSTILKTTYLKLIDVCDAHPTTRPKGKEYDNSASIPKKFYTSVGVAYFEISLETYRQKEKQQNSRKTTT
ncbi:neurotransmitter gated ion channel [Penaeus vannamei]|uniref:Neurotransmitter gated ion channel n=1 Tax=Penaeus vannamei TaxID=6689 RepID=A0A3R7MKP6_PENVA|nr:neurotransmitter gated ion channel [Penaeus vannamei]